MTTTVRGRRPRLRFFAGAGDEARARRAGDVIALALSVAGLCGLATVASPPSRAESAVIDLLQSLPGFLDVLWALAVDAVTALAAVIVVATSVRRRWALLRDLAVAVAVAAGVVLVMGRIVEGTWPDVLGTIRAGGGTLPFPATQVALAGAVITAAAPHLGRPVRRLGTSTLWVAVAASPIIGAATPSRAVAGALVAVIGGAAAHLAFGSSRGRPRLDDVAAALDELGVEVTALHVAHRQPAGVFTVTARDGAGEPLQVKVYGRDASDTEIVTTTWRSLWYRDRGTPSRVGRLWQVEHEALLTLLASAAGVPTYGVVVAGATVRSDALLVLRPTGRRIADEAQGIWMSEVLASSWEALRRLHSAGITHGQVDADHLFAVADDAAAAEPGDAGVGLVDFRHAAVGAGPDLMRRDQAQLFVASLLAAGEGPATAAAQAALGADGLAAALPFVQMPVLTSAQRTEVRRRRIDLDDVGTAAAAVLRIARPELQQLRRVTLRSLVQPALMVLAFLAVVQVVGNVDFGAVADELGDASWWWIGLGVGVAQLPRLAQVFSAMGASPVPLPFGPVYALQLGVAYINLVVPSSAARIAVNVRFLQRQGLSRGAALAVGAVDGFGGFVVQIGVVVALLAFTGASLDLDLDSAVSGGPGRVLGVVVALVVAAAAVIAAVPTLRRRVVDPGRAFLAEASGALRGLGSPRRLGLLAGGNLASDIAIALALGAFARGLGFDLGLGELLLAVVGVSLLAGALPVPGGIGVIEGGLILALASAGVPDEPAFAIVAVHRLATFYLPPLWGFAAFRWLERNRYL